MRPSPAFMGRKLQGLFLSAPALSFSFRFHVRLSIPQIDDVRPPAISGQDDAPFLVLVGAIRVHPQPLASLKVDVHFPFQRYGRVLHFQPRLFQRVRVLVEQGVPLRVFFQLLLRDPFPGQI